MKKYNILFSSLCAAVVALLAAALAACTADPIEFDAGSDAAFDPVGEARPGFYSALADADTLVQVWVKPGDVFKDQITFGLPKEAPEDLTVTIEVADDQEWLKAYNVSHYFPRKYDFRIDGEVVASLNRNFAFIPPAKLTVPTGEMKIKKGSYGIDLPLTVDMSDPEEGRCNFFVMLETTVPNADGSPIRYRIRYHFHIDPLNMLPSLEREKGHGDSNLGFVVAYLDPSWLVPSMSREYRLKKTAGNWNSGESSSDLYEFIDAVAIFGGTIGYDTENKMPVLKFNSNLFHILRNNQKYLNPLHDYHIRSTMVISGAGQGIGFCNLDEGQRASLVAQIKKTVTNYNLDGVTLMDESTGYGKEGMPLIDPASYALFIRDLRTALGSNKLILLVDSGEPAATLYEALDGVEAGQHLDYAWTGKSWDFTDPYADPSRGTIAGLDKDRYGRFAFRYRDSSISSEEINNVMEELYIEAETNDPKNLAFELMPGIHGAEGSTGPTRIGNIVNAICPYLDDGTLYSMWELDPGWTMVSFEDINVGKLPSYANQLYFPDWLRY